MLAYTREACLDREQQRLLAAQCGCISERLLLPWPLSSMPGCHSVDIAKLSDPVQKADASTRYLCHSKLMTPTARNRLQSKCLPRCVGTRYPFSTNVNTLAGYNSQDHEKCAFNCKVFLEILSRMDAPESKESIDGNSVLYPFSFTNLELTPQILQVKNVTETEVYPLQKFAADVGGVLGLWLGFSLITIVEVMELLVRAPFDLLLRKKGAGINPTDGAAADGVDKDTRL